MPRKTLEQVNQELDALDNVRQAILDRGYDNHTIGNRTEECPVSRYFQAETGYDVVYNDGDDIWAYDLEEGEEFVRRGEGNIDHARLSDRVSEVVQTLDEEYSNWTRRRFEENG